MEALRKLLTALLLIAGSISVIAQGLETQHHLQTKVI